MKQAPAKVKTEVEAILQASLPPSALVTEWAFLRGKDTSFVFRVDVETSDWQDLVAEMGLVRSQTHDALDDPRLPEWGRGHDGTLSVTDDIWTSGRENHSHLQFWIANDSSEKNSVVGHRDATVFKLPSEVWELTKLRP